MAVSPTTPRSSTAERLPPAVLLNPSTFVGALAVFVVGSLIVSAILGRK